MSINEDMSLHTPDLQAQPHRGILKHGNVPSSHRRTSSDRRAHWDEEKLQFISDTKDYGYMKIDEPKTPYHAPGIHAGDDVNAVPPLTLGGSGVDDSLPIPSELGKADAASCSSSHDWSDGDDDRPQSFRAKRKQHYNEFYNAQLARQLLAQEAELENDD